MENNMIGKEAYLEYSGGSTFGKGIIQKCKNSELFNFEIKLANGIFRFNKLETKLHKIRLYK